MPINNGSTYTEEAPNTASLASDHIESAASEAQKKVADLGRTAAEKIDQNRAAAADGLQNAASKLHEKAEALPGGEKVTSVAHNAADKLTATAEYVRQNNVNSMIADIQNMVRNNP